MTHGPIIYNLVHISAMTKTGLHDKMTKVSPAQLNNLFLFSKLRANLLLVSWLLMNVSLQKHNQLTFTSGLHT